MSYDAFATVIDACRAPSALVAGDGRISHRNAAFVQRFGHAMALAALVPDADAAVPGVYPVNDGRLHVQPLGEGVALVQWIAGDASAEQKQLQMFADTVAHDLRAPLRSIDSFGKLLEDRAGPKLDASERMHLSRIRAATARMSGLLAALGELSRASSASLTPQDIDISVLAEWAAAELADGDAARVVHVDVQPGLRACGDERLVRQALNALLDNAWRFTRSRDDARIVVRGREVDGRVEIDIRDNGIGFDMDYAHKLFQPFQRLHGVEQGAGHGLGLATAQRIARRHGGDLRATSTADGCVFTLVLPAPAGEGDR